MKTKLLYLKLTTCTLFILPVISILSLQAQDYLINFTGSGASNAVDSVKIENLTQGTKLKMKGSDVLRLTVVTGIVEMSDNETGKVSFYPNPMKDYAKMQFVLPVSGETLITLYDISGRKISQTRELLSAGKHIYGIMGIEEGIFFIRINSGRYSCSGRLLSSGSQNAGAKVIYENTLAIQENQSDSKGTNEEKIMQYTAGDRLLLKGISGIYSTVVTDVPTAGKTITFNFIPCTDGNGNNYPIVQISTAKGTTADPEEDKGVQTWMATNLKATKSSDGSNIDLVSDNAVWRTRTTPAYCHYNNNASEYGPLYNWYAVSTVRLCPDGWHVPTKIDWTKLFDSLGGSVIAGGKLKETGKTHWNNPNRGATNETGFTGLAGGYRNDYGSFDWIKFYGEFWGIAEGSSPTCWFMTLDYESGGVGQGQGNNPWSKYGFSVRCLKD